VSVAAEELDWDFREMGADCCEDGVVFRISCVAKRSMTHDNDEVDVVSFSREDILEPMFFDEFGSRLAGRHKFIVL